ncbi:hypothetical protein [Methanospirillum sp.]|uniref:hypothetical protein n=1 Tax=Methanospirillum sp. TaxID=45200 RepID=UPI001BD52861|nr:hypothetical protein [Methanospirillum sp.]
MTEEDPLSIVQVRYARGEIDTAEYNEFYSCFLKNISFQQVPSLNIASERYANGEISIGEYKEIISHLLNDISNYQQSAPLRIVHLRYAEGVIETEEFEEKIEVLMRDIPAYPHTPPLSVLFMRYAKGEVDNLRYQEMLSHLVTYSMPTLPERGGEEAAASPGAQKNVAPAPKPGGAGAGEKTPTSSPPLAPKPPVQPQGPDPYRLNFSAQVQRGPSMAGEAQVVNPEIHEGMQSAVEAGGLGSAPMIMDEPEIMVGTAPEITAEQGSYHITDISASSTPVTVLVKPEADMAKKETTISFKQNIVEAKPEEEEGKKSEQEKPLPGTAPEPENVISEVATSPSGNHQKIKALIKQGKYFESITRLDEMLVQSPDDYRSLFLKSIALFNIGKGDEALEILSKAKETCTNKDDAKEIERIYSHIAQKGGSKNGQKKEREIPQVNPKNPAKVPSLTDHPEREVNKNSAAIESICTKAQSLIDAEDYKGANEILADIQELVKDIPVETMQRESIDDLFAAKGFVLYQMKEFCEAKKFFKEATKINPKNETAIHYLNDIRVRDCNKFVRHV